MGHLGFDRVVASCQNLLYWRKYESDINNYATKSWKCLKDKKSIRSQRAPLETVSTTQPFELITIDYLHLDQYKGGYEYLLVLVGHFTKFAQVFSTKNKSGRSSVDMLFNKYFLDSGLPKRILHDQGKEFNNKLFKRLSQIAGVKPSRTYHPMGNGFCEIMNRTLFNMLRILPTNFKID